MNDPQFPKPGPQRGWANTPKKVELPDLVMGDLAQEMPKAIREATAKLFPKHSSNDPLDTAGGRAGRVTTTASLSGKKPQEQMCDGCGKPSDGVLTGNQNGQYLCNACFGPEKALIRPVAQAKCDACGQPLK